jgi:hypothetical protein
MTDELGDAFDEVSESDEATNDLFRRAQSLDDTKRFGEGLIHEGALYSSPVIQGETDLARAAWQKAEQMSGGHVVDKAVEGYELLHDGNPQDVWEDIEPKDQPDALDVATDMVGGGAVAGFQTGMKMEENLVPGSPLAPAGRAVYDEWPAAKVAMNGDPDHGIPYKNPEIPDTDAVVGGDVSDQVVAAPDVVEDFVATTDANEMPAVDPTTYDTATYDTSAPATFDTSSYDTSTDAGGAFGATGDDSGSSFTDF